MTDEMQFAALVTSKCEKCGLERGRLKRLLLIMPIAHPIGFLCGAGFPARGGQVLDLNLIGWKADATTARHGAVSLLSWLA